MRFRKLSRAVKLFGDMSCTGMKVLFLPPAALGSLQSWNCCFAFLATGLLSCLARGPSGAKFLVALVENLGGLTCFGLFWCEGKEEPARCIRVQLGS